MILAIQLFQREVLPLSEKMKVIIIINHAKNIKKIFSHHITVITEYYYDCELLLISCLYYLKKKKQHSVTLG